MCLRDVVWSVMSDDTDSFGVRHLTVVPENFDPPASDVDPSVSDVSPSAPDGDSSGG